MDAPWQPRALLALGVFVAWTSGLAVGSTTMSLLLVAAVLIAAWQMWLPVHYEIGPQGITQHWLGRQRRITWSAIGRVQRRDCGLLLLRDLQPMPLEALRGLYLPFGQQKSEVLAIVDYYLVGRASQSC